MPPLNYSPGHKREKKFIQAMSEMACCIGVPIWLVALRQCRMETGRGRTQEGGIYSRE